MVTLSDQEYQQMRETISQLRKENALLRRKKTTEKLKEKIRSSNSPAPLSTHKAKIVDKLFGILNIPESIDYKDILADELVKKYLNQ